LFQQQPAGLAEAPVLVSALRIGLLMVAYLSCKQKGGSVDYVQKTVKYANYRQLLAIFNSFCQKTP
jgi:hypothetical protein